MLEEFAERIQNAKDKQFKMLERFHLGDTVYPFWLHDFLVYGTVIDIDTVARKIICDFNGVSRQFCPEDLMHVNPAFVSASAKGRTAKVAKDKTHLSQDTDNGINAVCKECGGEVAVSYDEQCARSDFVCTKCGKRIPEENLSQKSKRAMRENQARKLSAALQNGKSLDIDGARGLANLLKSTLKDIDQGKHCWCQLPSGNWFCTEPEEEDGKGILCCFINEKIDSLGYPSGKILVDLGCVCDESDCDDMAEYAFDTDEEFIDGGDKYDANHAAEWMEKHPHGWYNSESDYGTGDEDDGRLASRKTGSKAKCGGMKIAGPGAGIDFQIQDFASNANEIIYRIKSNGGKYVAEHIEGSLKPSKFSAFDYYYGDDNSDFDYVFSDCKVNENDIANVVDDFMDYYKDKDWFIEGIENDNIHLALYPLSNGANTSWYGGGYIRKPFKAGNEVEFRHDCETILYFEDSNEKIDSVNWTIGLTGTVKASGEDWYYDVFEAPLEDDDDEEFDDWDDDEPDPDEYDADHAAEWMEKHPHGWYNSESDYGTGDEDED